MARCKDCWVLEEHPEIIDEDIVFGDGCPAEDYGFDCPFLELFELEEELEEAEWEEIEEDP